TSSKLYKESSSQVPEGSGLAPTLRIHKDHPKSQIIGPNLRRSLMLCKTQAGWKLCKKSSFNSKFRKSGLWLIVLKGSDPLGQNSQPQETCNSDKPKSNRNSNPTATSINPPTDQLEKLTVETPIPTVSSPVPTACLNDSPKPSIYQMDVKSDFLYGTIDEEVGTIDQTLFIIKQRGDFILVQVYVDDIIFGSSNPQLCREFEALMHEKFQMSTMGELNFFLGLQVLQKKDGIFLSQDKYVGDILKKFGYFDVISSNTPMDKENPWGKDGTGKDGHPKLGLWYPKDSPFNMVAYSDSDYGGATQDRKSTTGGCQFLG
nr:hypothetical protein [Tanacetum cinerariifolium]